METARICDQSVNVGVVTSRTHPLRLDVRSGGTRFISRRKTRNGVIRLSGVGKRVDRTLGSMVYQEPDKDKERHAQTPEGHVVHGACG